jgi:hypothetical protein
MQGQGRIVTRDKREDYIYSRAYELAATGLHLEPITIIAALIKEGYPEAAELLDSPLIRNDLRQVCARNWRARIPKGRQTPSGGLRRESAGESRRPTASPEECGSR